MEKQIIVVKPKTLSPKDKEKLTKAGNVVIEHPSPTEISYKPHTDTVEFVYTNCYTCGDRVYMTQERMKALKNNKKGFYCSQGHSTVFS